MLEIFSLQIPSSGGLNDVHSRNLLTSLFYKSQE